MASFNDTMMAFMGIFYAGLGAGQAAVFMGDAAKAKVPWPYIACSSRQTQSPSQQLLCC